MNVSAAATADANSTISANQSSNTRPSSTTGWFNFAY